MRRVNNFFAAFLLIVFVKPLSAQTDSNFVLVKKGVYAVGKKGHSLNPQRKVSVNDFYISKTETTNEEFKKFIDATGYKTDAERAKNAMVFKPGLKEFEWLEDSTAYWKFPNGISRGGVENKMDHPVTCISYSDIQAYCKWAGVRLPTLDEWEIAARAGSGENYFFGSINTQISKYANIWKGRDHLIADSTDGYMYTSPVKSFEPNKWGLYDVYGNVFEFCSGKLKNDQNTTVHARGGSWWCSKNACNFFNSYDIGRVNIHASFSNQGFRVVK
jgi:formylglycine-generating enzyme